EATKTINTAVCWSVLATMIEFSPRADISVFRGWSVREFGGVGVDATVVTFRNVRVVRTVRQFRLFVGSMPIGFYFPHWTILKIWDEAGIVCELVDD
ncbi:MAG: hypothetical protein AAB602_00445, partial [Patescibacteria group bacterium]